MLQTLQDIAEKYPLVIQPLSSFLAILFAFIIAFYVQNRIDKRQQNNHIHERDERKRTVEREKIELIFKAVESYINNSLSLISLLSSNLNINSHVGKQNTLENILIKNAINLNSGENNVSEAAIISKLNFHELVEISDAFVNADLKFYSIIEIIIQSKQPNWKTQLLKEVKIMHDSADKWRKEIINMSRNKGYIK